MFFIISLISSTNVFAQKDFGILTGRILDGTSYLGLSGVSVSKDSVRKGTLSLAGGRYYFNLIEGKNIIYFKYPGYETKIISDVFINPDLVVNVDILLFPLPASDKYFGKNLTKGKNLPQNKTQSYGTPLLKEISNIIYNPVNNANTVSDQFTASKIASGTDKDAGAIVNRLNGVMLQSQPGNNALQSIQIGGLGPRYNQLIFNGAVFNSMNATSRSYPLELLPAEAIELITLHNTSRPSLPADFAGGTIEIKTKDIPETDFFLVQAGGGFSSGTRDKIFLSDNGNPTQFTSFSGNVRNLPAQFPTTRSVANFSRKNIQEQVDLSKLLRNNLLPVNNGRSDPDYRILLGFGKRYKYKKNLVIGITGYVNYIKEELIELATVQVSPNVINNPFPFSDSSKILINGQSKDLNYKYSSRLGGILNTSFFWRNNKISIRNYLGNQLYNNLSVRSNVSKPDENPAASDGLRYTTEENKFWNAQVAGEHSLGDSGKLRVDWQLTYNYMLQQNPDERNFLLNRDISNTDLVEIAKPISAPFDPIEVSTHAPNFTNSARLWRNAKENNFNASLNIKVPLKLFGYPQMLNGGLYLQSLSRNFVSDLLLVNGTGYTTQDKLLSPERYFPGGLTITNYFSNLNRMANGPVSPINRGSYFGFSSVGASYLFLENQLLKNTFLQWGFRLEAGNQSTGTVQYEFVPGFRNPQRFTIQDNSRQIQFNLLPSANLVYIPIKMFQLNANYSRTVNRPLLQEVNAYNYYDAASFLVKSGNPFLDNATIDNFSAGFKWLRNAATHISLSGFYKKIDQPIEEVVSAYSTGNMYSNPFNMPKATVKGVQVDGRIGLKNFTSRRWLSNMSFFASGVILKSKVEAGPLRSVSIPFSSEHTLSNTPNYSFNMGIVVQYPYLPELSVVYSESGDYIEKVGSGNVLMLANGNRINAVPDYRIKGRGQLNAQISQKLFRLKFQIIAGVTNLLNDPYVMYQDLNGNKKFDEPLSVTSGISNKGFYKSGVDNTIVNIKSQRNYYVRLSFQF